MTDQQDHDPQLAFLWEAAEGWKEYQSLITGVIEKLDWEDLPKSHAGIKFKSVWRDLSIDETGLIVIDSIMVPPKACREKTYLTNPFRTLWRK